MAADQLDKGAVQRLDSNSDRRDKGAVEQNEAAAPAGGMLKRFAAMDGGIGRNFVNAGMDGGMRG